MGAGGRPAGGRRAARPLGPLGCARCRASACGPSTTWSGWGLTTSWVGGAHLGACFALRCGQRLSATHVATQRCFWRNNWYTSGEPLPVLSYWGAVLAILPRLWRIETELSHDVLNPARVPL